MRWLSRSTERAVDAAAPIPGSGAAAATVRPSPGLAALLTALATRPERRVLDLGPAVAANLSRYSAVARAVRFVDLLREGEQPDAALEGVAGDGPYDAILAWDLLDYLPAPATAELVRRLAACASPGARLFAMFSTSRTIPASPGRFEIVEGGKLTCHEAPGQTRPGPLTPPAEVERRLVPFRVERAYLLLNGVREFVAVLPG